jgi:hypothetical protein
VVYVHGYNNCVRNIVRPAESACNCSANGDVRVAYGLIDQFERAASAVAATSSLGERETRKRMVEGGAVDNNINWLFVAAEVAYDEANDDPG